MSSRDRGMISDRVRSGGENISKSTLERGERVGRRKEALNKDLRDLGITFCVS